MPILTFLDISTCHITSKDAEVLRRIRPGNGTHLAPPRLIVQPYEYGWTISTSGMLDGDEDRAERLAAMIDEGFSEHFIKMMLYAADNGTQMVRLDCDAGLEPGLPTFDWEKNDEMTPAEEVASPMPGR